MSEGLTEGWFPTWNEDLNEGTFGCSPERKPKGGYVRMFPQNENRNEGTFAKTTLWRNRPFVSSRICTGTLGVTLKRTSCLFVLFEGYCCKTPLSEWNAYLGGRLMCTNKCAQPEGHVQRLGGLLSNHPNQNKRNNKLSNEKVHCQKVSATFPCSLKCRKFQGKCKNATFSRTVFANEKTHFGPTLNTCISRCMAGSTKKPSFLAIFCSSACARLLVHVGYPLIAVKEHRDWRQDAKRRGAHLTCSFGS